jgi:hypothetical protein
MPVHPQENRPDGLRKARQTRRPCVRVSFSGIMMSSPPAISGRCLKAGVAIVQQHTPSDPKLQPSDLCPNRAYFTHDCPVEPDDPPDGLSTDLNRADLRYSIELNCSNRNHGDADNGYHDGYFVRNSLFDHRYAATPDDSANHRKPAISRPSRPQNLRSLPPPARRQPKPLHRPALVFPIAIMARFSVTITARTAASP